jgi:CheY-like chemotaxis protein
MKTVLVIDDVPANVDVVLGFLAEAGTGVPPLLIHSGAILFT